MSVKELARKCKEATVKIRISTAQNRNQALFNIKKHILENKENILKANAKDVEAARANKLNEAMIDRLSLTEERITSMALSAENIANQDEVVFQIAEEYERNGLLIKKQQVPLGVIAMIFESRPNVVVDCSCLAIKSGNGIILKGGKEAFHSNRILADIVTDAISDHLPKEMIQLIEAREEVFEIITLKDYVDVVIPRGGKKLIQYVYDNSAVPVIAHFEGLCHVYIHKDADKDFAKNICLNAKVQRPGVCNAMETLLIHKDFDKNTTNDILKSLIDKGVEIFGCQRSQELNNNIQKAQKEHYHTEYLDKKLSLKIVDNAQDAIHHIQEHGTNHTECIIAHDPLIITNFENSIDASCIMVNTSTRFNDGGELGLGAELGISTTKFHAYGPMGAKEMTTSRFVVSSLGKVRK